MPTPHNQAKKDEIAKVVLMPGDPKRARWIAETFLHDVKLVNEVRGNFCFTGLTKNNKRISVMSSGMGNPSMGIYSHELYADYDVDFIIRVGTCGSYQDFTNFRDIIVGENIVSDSNYGAQLGLDCSYVPHADKKILQDAVESIEKFKYSYHAGTIFAADVFYDFKKDTWKEYAKRGVLAVEMESFALYINAEYFKKKAITLLTVTDHFIKPGKLSIEERQTGLINMISAAIDLAEKYA